MARTPEAPLADQTLSAFLEWIAATYASRPALLYKPSLKTQVWTYRDLQHKAYRVAHWLQEQGVGRGDRVVIWGQNSPWWVACFFGILRNGSVVVPLDARSSADFVERVIAQSEPRLAIASSSMARTWSYDVPVSVIEELDSFLPDGGPESLPEVSPDDLAEIIFTSGTTGAPKGVMLTHGNIRSNVEAVNQVFPAGPQFRPLSILPLSHLLEQTCGLLLALRGGTAIAYATALQPAAIQRDMAQYRVTTMVLVPRILSMFMESIERGVRKAGKEDTWRRACRIAEHLPMPERRILFRNVLQRFGGRLTFLVTGGAPLEPELEHKWELLGIAILQGYGSTETSPIITATALDDRKPRSVGKRLPGTQLRLTDDGEILVKGPNVMQGYWKNPEATAAVLEDGWYHTGDLGELDAEGRLYLKGRKKNMIVLANGLNVYPEDVEEALGRSPGAVEAVVMAVPSSFGPQIHAVLLCSAQGADPVAIVREANERLAPHQQVRTYEVWPEPDFPRTHTAKVKRADVAKFVLAEQRGEKVAVPAPTLQTSKKPPLVQILAEVVGRPAGELTAGTRLEQIGLDAARRIRLGRAVEDRLGKFVDDARIGAETTVGELESLLSSENPSGEHLYPLWPFSHRIQQSRSLLQAPLFAAQERIVRPRIVGRDHLRGMALPAIFVMEYRSVLAAPLALAAMPARIRRRVGISTTWKTERKNRWIGSAVAFSFNSFRYSQSGSLHTSLVHASGLLDHRWSILFLLRGDPARHGRGSAITASIGLLAAEFGVPVVPMRIEGLHEDLPRLRLPRRGAVAVHFGKPITCGPGMSYLDVDTALEAEFRSLAEQAGSGWRVAGVGVAQDAPHATLTAPGVLSPPVAAGARPRERSAPVTRAPAANGERHASGPATAKEEVR
jgi:long-chain acyl-CoA synthetase